MLQFRWATAVVAGLLASTLAMGQVNDDAKRVLEESREAINNIQSVTYQAKRSGTGALQGTVDASGSVKFMRTKSDLRRSPMSFVGEGNRPPKGNAPFNVASDGNVITWQDLESSTIFERPYKIKSPEYKDYNFAQQALLLQEFIKADAFAEELKANSLTVEGIGEVHGEACDIIKAAWKNDKGEMTRSAVWFIGVADRLPRKLELRNGDDKNNLSMIRELWDMNPGAGLKLADFAMATPAGFKRDVQQAAAEKPTVDPGKDLPPAPPVGAVAGTPMPAWELKDIGGSSVSSNSTSGSVVVLAFWGTRFPRSVDANADIQRVADRFKDNASVKVFGVACKELSAEAPAKVVQERGFSFPVLTGGEELAKGLKVNGYPTVVVVGKDGKVAQFMQGAPGVEAVATAVQNALK